AIAPGWNPFNALYNHTAGKRHSLWLRSLPPRMFAEAMAGSVALGIGVLLALGQSGPAILLESVFLIGNAAAVFAGFCSGAALFFRLRDSLACFRNVSRPGGLALNDPG